MRSKCHRRRTKRQRQRDATARPRRRTRATRMSQESHPKRPNMEAMGPQVQSCAQSTTYPDRRTCLLSAHPAAQQPSSPAVLHITAHNVTLYPGRCLKSEVCGKQDLTLPRVSEALDPQHQHQHQHSREAQTSSDMSICQQTTH